MNPWTTTYALISWRCMEWALRTSAFSRATGTDSQWWRGRGGILETSSRVITKLPSGTLYLSQSSTWPYMRSSDTGLPWWHQWRSQWNLIWLTQRASGGAYSIYQYTFMLTVYFSRQLGWHAFSGPFTP